MADSPPRPVRILDAAALAVLIVQIVLRLTVRTEGSQWGTSLLISLLVFAAAGTWFAARALEGRLEWRFTGFEAPLAGLWLLSLLSIPRASFPLAALDGSLRIGSLALLLPIAVNMFGLSRRRLLFAFMNAAILAIALFGLVQYFWLLPSMQASDEVQRHIEAQGDLAPELRGRLEAREPSGTFFYPNTFAGFLVLTIPFAVGFALDGSTSPAAGGLWRRRAVGILAATAGAFCLALTGSTGGIVAGAAAALAFAVLAVARKFPGARRWLVGVCVAAMLSGVTLVAAGPLSPDRLGRRIETIAVRDVYWDAAARMARDHPLWGVGIHHFGEYYPAYKDDRQEETRQAHNDYLQVLAELGVPGLLCFLMVLVVGARRTLDPEPEDPPPPAPTDRAVGLVSAAIPIGLLAAFGLQGSGENIGLVALLAVAWIAAFRTVGHAVSVDGRWTRIGLAAGVAGAAVHFLVDFDFHDPSFAEAFMLSLAALALLSRAPEPWTLGTRSAALAGVACFVLALPTFAAFVPRYLAAEAASDEAREAFSEARRAETEGRRTDADALYDLAARTWEQASHDNGLDPVASLQLGILRFERWRSALEDGREAGSIEQEVLFESARGALENARRVRERWGAPAFWLAELRLRAGRELALRARSGSATPEAGALAVQLLGDAQESAREAVRLYPTRAQNRYLLGRALEAGGSVDEAAAEYREALRLSGLAVRVPRLGLDPFQRAGCLLKSGGSREEAQRLLEAHLATLLPPAGSRAERSEAARRIALDWKRAADDAMDALIDRAFETVSSR